MQIFSIYKATNKVNGKIYIGFASNWINRQQQHKKSAFNSKLIDHNYIFHKAIRKHGWEAFNWEVLYEHLDGEYLLNVVEPYFIDVYQSFGKNGYNMTKGGEGPLGYKHTDEAKRKMSREGKLHSNHTKQLMSIAHIGRKRSIETKLKMSNAKKGKIFSEQHIENLSISSIGNTRRAKHYLLIDPEENEHQITNLVKFCRDNPQYNLNYKALSRCINNNQNYKNWKVKAAQAKKD